ncbi:MAG: NTP transferase domain-containing protein [Peptococcaceae bacterium]|nr:NTP transferase domain-containing protein [Peptococcaceae bacterium]
MGQGDIKNIAALILAAGFSSRMGAFKPLLPLGAATVIEWVITTFRSAGATDIKVVIGYRALDMVAVLKSLPVDVIENGDYPSGMFSSVKAGVKAITPEVEAFFILPVDIPLIAPLTINKMLEAYRIHKAGVVYPCFDGERGHPPLISAANMERILSWNGEGGLRNLLRQWEHEAVDVEVDDQGVLMDMDTPGDYRRIREKHGRGDIPSERECLSLLKSIGVPDAVARHCRVVAGVAGDIARALNKAGCRLNIDLILAAGLLHDIAKGKADHALAGAEYLRELGYARVADIVESHMDRQSCVGGIVTEADVVFLADKLVQEDKVVSLEQRFQHARDRLESNPDIVSCIEKRYRQAGAIKREVEKIIASLPGK